MATDGLLERDERRCSQCEVVKPLDDFWTAWDNRYSYRRTRSYCKECGKKYNDQVKYKLSPADKQRLYEQQEGRCAICGKDGRLVVDHNHSTGEVRGLLCSQCNTALGMFKDNPDLLAIALDYLGGV